MAASEGSSGKGGVYMNGKREREKSTKKKDGKKKKEDGKLLVAAKTVEPPPPDSDGEDSPKKRKKKRKQIFPVLTDEVALNLTFHTQPSNLITTATVNDSSP